MDTSDFAELLGTPLPPSPVKAEAALPTVSAVAVGSPPYEGASRTDNLALWQPSTLSADDEIDISKGPLDARVRYMLRNDSSVAGAATYHKDSIVGSLFLLNAKPMSAVLFNSEDEVWEEEAQEEIEMKFGLWAESPECWADAQRTKTLTDIVRLAVGVDLAGGEILASAEWMPDDGRPFRTAIQMIDTDRLCTPFNAWNNNRIRRGVEINAKGAPVAYHIRMAHPGDYANPESYLWRRVMARKPWGRPMILHQLEELRPDQHRGLSMMVGALQEMKMLKGFRKTELERAVLAASYAASIESELPSADIFRMMGGEDGNGASIDLLKDYLEAINEFSVGSKNLVVNGTRIPVMMPGTKLNIKNPGAESPAGSDFERSMQAYIAVSAGMSLEQFSRDYRNVNYSGGRMSRGETEKHLAARKRRTADRTATFLYRLWLEEAINTRSLECFKRRRMPEYYEGQNADAYSNCEWIGAGLGQIDPLKETQAIVLQLKNGLTTKEVAIAKLNGGDWRAVTRQIAREMRNDEKFKTPSVYAMAMSDAENALSGTPQVRENDGESGDEQ